MPVEAPVYIYALCAPDGTVGYIGQTGYAIERRLRPHIALLPHDESHKSRWLGDLLAQGLTPCAQLLEITDSDHANAVEQRFIDSYRAQGHPLTNDGEPRGFHQRRVKAHWVTRAVKVPPAMAQRISVIATQMDRPIGHVMYVLLAEALAARATPGPAAPAQQQEG